MEINYVEAVETVDPTAQISTIGSPMVYENITWEAEPIPEASLVAAFISNAKQLKINYLNEKMIKAFETTKYPCDVLYPGFPKLYSTNMQSQIGLSNAVILTDLANSLPGKVYLFPAFDPVTGFLSFYPHNHDQFIEVLRADGEKVADMISYLQSRINEVIYANDTDPHVTLDIINAVEWDYA